MRLRLNGLGDLGLPRWQARLLLALFITFSVAGIVPLLGDKVLNVTSDRIELDLSGSGAASVHWRMGLIDAIGGWGLPFERTGYSDHLSRVSVGAQVGAGGTVTDCRIIVNGREVVHNTADGRGTLMCALDLADGWP